MTKQPVFVYGILLGDATVGATLHGWKLESFGNLTITESEGDHVLGGIVYADQAQIARYDRIEGFRPDGSGYYRTEMVVVDTLDGATVLAMAYVMNERCRVEAQRRMGRRDGDPGDTDHWVRTRELQRLGMSAPAETIHDTTKA